MLCAVETDGRQGFSLTHWGRAVAERMAVHHVCYEQGTKECVISLQLIETGQQRAG